MAFVNEQLTNEKIISYGLEELFLKYRPFSLDANTKRIKSSIESEWTVDHDESTFLIPLGRLEPRESPNVWSWLLSVDGNESKLKLEINEKSGMLDSNRYLRVWNLICIDQVGVKKDVEDQLLLILKDALVVHGEGAYAPKDSSKFLVEFNF